MILAKVVSHLRLLNRNATERDPTRALDQRQSPAGAMKRKGKMLTTDRPYQVHWKDVADIACNDTHKILRLAFSGILKVVVLESVWSIPFSSATRRGLRLQPFCIHTGLR